MPVSAGVAGFRTFYSRERDYDGTFDWTRRATRPKLSMGAVPLTVHANFGIFSGPETVYVINDNNGGLFEFERAWNESWTTRDALSKIIPALPAVTAGPDIRALAAVRLLRWPEWTGCQTFLSSGPSGFSAADLRPRAFRGSASWRNGPRQRDLFVLPAFVLGSRHRQAGRNYDEWAVRKYRP
jgi:hypothetical protein